MDKDNKQENERDSISRESDSSASSLRYVDDVESGSPTLDFLPISSIHGNMAGDKQLGEMGEVASKLVDGDEGDMMYDGHDLTKASIDNDCESAHGNETIDDHRHQSCPQPSGTSSTISLTPSLRAAAPTSLRSSRQLSSPGAFRMGLGGVTVPARDEIIRNDSQASTESVGFQTHNAHEVLIEATLVSDQLSLATEEDETRSTRRRQPDSAHLSVVTSDQPLVEATRMHRFCLFDMVGNWKAICFIILVIIAIAAVAAVIERYRPVVPSSNVGDSAFDPFSDEVQNEAFPMAAPSVATTTGTTLAPTRLELSAVSMLSITEDTETPSSFPSESPVEEEKPPTQSPSRLRAPSSMPQPKEALNPTALPTERPSLKPTQVPTHGPSLMPSSTTAFLNLAEETIVALLDPRSPQSLAMDWMLEDPMQNVYSTSLQRQRYALATFYFALNGELWINRTHWLSYDVGFCQWHTDLEPPESVCSSTATPQDPEFRALVMFTNDLVGTLPRETFLLSSLSTIALFEQPIRGTLPDEVGNLSDMKELVLRQLVFTGSLPTTLGRLRQLTSLMLDKNWFEGPIPSELQGVQSLKQLFLSGNELTGSLPTLKALSQLEILSLHSNSLTGSVPTHLFESPNLQKVYMSNNQFSGELPSDLASSSLQIIDLGNNKLSGTLPSTLGLLTNAQVLDLYGNHFTGAIPSELGLLWNVSAIMLDSNNLTNSNNLSPVPSQLGLLTNLGALLLHNNGLTGSLPDEICALKAERKDLVISVDCDKVSCSCDCCDCNCGLSPIPTSSLMSRTMHDDLHQSKLP